jgi:hypothetical protein
LCRSTVSTRKCSGARGESGSAASEVDQHVPALAGTGTGVARIVDQRPIRLLGLAFSAPEPIQQLELLRIRHPVKFARRGQALDLAPERRRIRLPSHRANDLLLNAIRILSKRIRIRQLPLRIRHRELLLIRQ